MRKRILSLLLTLCLVATLLPFATFAAEEEKYVSVRVDNAGTYVWNTEGVDQKMKAGDATRYLTTTSEGVVAVGTADNWNIKLEYPAGGKPTVTLKGATLKGAKSRTPLTISGNVDCTVCVEADSTISSYGTGLYFSNLGLATITGPGKLTITTTDGNCISFVGTVSNPKGTAGLIKDAKLDLYPTGTSTGRPAINFYGGDLTIDNSKINISGSDEKSVGIWGYCHVTKDANGNVTKIIGYWREMDLDETERNLTIQNGSVITAKVAIKVLGATGNITIKDSTVEGEGKAGFSKKPTIEGEYTAVGGSSKEKVVEYNPDKATGYSYFKVVPGKVDLGELGVEVVPPVTEPPVTEPPVTEPKPTETKPVESKPVESKPAESKPAETKPTEPVATKPVQTPSEDTGSGLPGAVIALVVVAAVSVLAASSLALCYFVIKPKWLVK